jgi:L-amino acid N-acyltransferase YncA
MTNLHIRPMADGDWPRMLAIYDEGLATGDATLETTAPAWETWTRAHCACP